MRAMSFYGRILTDEEMELVDAAKEQERLEILDLLSGQHPLLTPEDRWQWYREIRAAIQARG